MSTPGHRCAVVLNGYSRHNTGDWLLLEETVQFARTREPRASVIAIALDADSFHGRTSADRVLPSPVSTTAPLRGLAETVLALLSAGRWGSPALKAIRASDAIYSCGGGFVQFRSPRELVTAGLAHGTQLLAARLWRRPIVMLPQSIGPFEGAGGRAAGRFLLRAFGDIRVRDEASAVRIRALDGALAGRTRVLPDMVFAEPRAAAAPLPARRRIAVVVRNWWFPGAADPQAAQERYLDTVARAITRLQAAGHEVEAVVHSDGPTDRGDDRTATAQLVAALPAPIPVRSVCDAATPELAAERYRDYDLVISVRMHAALLAIREGVAAIAIAYEPKTEEIFGDLGLSDWQLPIDALDEDALVALATGAFPHDAVSERWAQLRSELLVGLGAVAA